VTEVALTAQFARPVIDFAMLGLFSERVRKEFPQQQQQPAAQAIEPETFGQAPSAPSFRIQLGPDVQLPRIWFESADGERLVQLQEDRLTVNWRLQDGDPTDYPRYSRLREIFQAQLKRVAAIAKSRDREINVTTCEVLYVNPIESKGKSSPGGHPDLAGVLDLVKRSSSKSFLGQPEDSQLQARWRIPGENGNPIGRLYLSAVPALSDDQKPIYLVQLFGRTAPAGSEIKDVMAALDIGHEWVVRGFADVTAKSMHKVWGREA
jgi:uncharacterized protein (TIGR04255 family)